MRVLVAVAVGPAGVLVAVAVMVGVALMVGNEVAVAVGTGASPRSLNWLASFFFGGPEKRDSQQRPFRKVFLSCTTTCGSCDRGR